MKERTAKSFFVYSWLRPDNDDADEVRMNWLKNGKAQKAVLHNAQLFKSISFDVVKMTECSDSVVHGWLVTFPDS